MNSSEQQAFMRLVRKLILLCAPIMLLLIATVLIDPFNSNSYLHLPINKEPVALVYNERLWKLNQFAQHPSDYLLIGDSRAQRIQAKQLQDLSGKPWQCIALSGATLVELIDTFWFAVHHSTLKEVLLCLNFDRFNDWQTASGVHRAQELIKHPLRAYVAAEVWKATLHLIASSLYHKQLDHQQPPISKELFWQEQLRDGKKRYERYVAPLYVQKELEHIHEYCSEHAITLTFVLLPTHIEFQQLISQTHLDNERAQFKQLLTKLGNVCDLDTPNEFTTDANNFSDPWHANWDTAPQLAKLIVTKTENI